MKVLYFEGAGMATEESVAAGVGNCRIRTAFHTADGKGVYLEIFAWRRETGTGKKRKTELVCYVDFAHFITGSSEDCNINRIADVESKDPIPYTLNGILSVVRKCGGDFDSVRVLPDLAGYRVHEESGCDNYNYGDEFAFDEVATAKREEIEAECKRLEYEARKQDAAERGGKWDNGPSGCIFTNYSLWVPDNRPDVLSWVIRGGDFCGQHEIDITVGNVRDCIKAATGWTDETYGDFSKAIRRPVK